MGRKTKKKPKIDMNALRADLTYLARLDEEIENRIKSQEPTTYGLPDLLRERAEGESEEDFAAWQDREIKGLIEEKMWIYKDGRKLALRISPPMLQFIADMFFRRANQAILWKGRGSGGTLCAAILVWLCLVYHRMSFTSMAGSTEQAKLIYQYTKSFWECFPLMSNALLETEPLQMETRLRTGVVLKIISASEKQSRGKHNPGFIVDESCQSSANVDYLIQAAMQGAMSEPNSMVIVLSTFHFPIGLFQELWDYAEERGFTRFNWNCYDSMLPCSEGMQLATPEDPEALEFCRTDCPLTEKQAVVSDEGVQTGWKYTGCNGKGRHTEGFQTRENLILAKKMNRGTDVFENEYENNRPKWMRPIYDPTLVDEILVPPSWPHGMAEGDEESLVVAERLGGIERFSIEEKAVGIDWGLEGQTALVLAAMIRFTRPPCDPKALPTGPPVDWCIGILETEFLSGKLASEAIKILMMWQEKYGPDDFFVYGDGSHPFNNLEVDQAGFNMTNVPFSKWKDYGVGNCVKYLVTPGRLFIRSNLFSFLDQIKRYRRDKFGKPIKKDDHGPDAFMCSMLHYRFEERFQSEDVPVRAPEPSRQAQQHPHRVTPGRVMRQASEFGVAPPCTPGVPQPAPPPQSPIDIRGRSGKTGRSKNVIII
jgi:hypothetical protein